MKNITVLLSCFLISGYASALTFEATGKLLDSDCAPLNETVNISLSNDVVAGAICTDGAVALTACHKFGRTATRTAPVCADTDGDETTGLNGKEDCSGGTTAQISGAAVASATTLAGTVTSQYPGEKCTVDIAEEQARVNAGE